MHEGRTLSFCEQVESLCWGVETASRWQAGILKMWKYAGTNRQDNTSWSGSVPRACGGEANDLASQLPRGIAEYLRTRLAGEGERFSVEDFFQRVSERAGVNLPKAFYHARAVIAVLYEAVSPGEMADVRAQLPGEFARLFEPEREDEG